MYELADEIKLRIFWPVSYRQFSLRIGEVHTPFSNIK